MHQHLKRHQIVLLGIGHTNAHLVRMWRMNPFPDTQLICVNNFGVATYSGMLPAVLAGQYPAEAMQIDLVRLCAASGARFIIGEVTGLDLDRRELNFADRAALPFDALSIGIGSQPAQNAAMDDDARVVRIKPMQTFLGRFESSLRRVMQGSKSPNHVHVAVVGTGVGGVEIAFCLPGQLRRVLSPDVLAKITLIGSSSEVAPGTAAGTQRRVLAALARANVDVLLERRVKHIQDGMIEFAQGEPLTADLVVWATGAAAPPTLQRLGLPTDERGFLLTRSTLQSTGADCVFAVGDTGTMQHAPTPKAGVYAVRQGPVLWNNLQRFLRGEALEEYRPQSDFLKLINTGDGRAIAEYKHCSSHARWCWHLKDRIDRGFMQKYQDYQPMPMQMPIASNSKDAAVMQCAGCGSKLGSSVLSQALAQLPIAEHPQIKIGLDQPDDAAVMRPLANQAITVTVDFFPAPLDDPYLVGRLAALNAASDLFAMGAKPVAALAMVTLPAGPEKRQAELLIELLRGARRELDLMRAVLAGGHTTEGERLTIGFSMIGNQTCEPPLTKAGLRPGDRLLLTKPLGSGVLLAAHMRARCDAHSMRELLDTMLTSNQLAAELAIAAGVRAMTDVTGFGLAGHLYEMLRASNVSAKLDLDHLPVLAAAPSLIASGIESTLAPSNRHVESAIAVDSAKRLSPAYSLLFDPQTSGGLLIAVAPERADSLRRELHQAGYFHTAEIGVVDSASSETAGASRLVI